MIRRLHMTWLLILMMLGCEGCPNGVQPQTIKQIELDALTVEEIGCVLAAPLGAPEAVLALCHLNPVLQPLIEKLLESKSAAAGISAARRADAGTDSGR